MKIWILVVNSCLDCNSLAVKAYEQEPPVDEIEQVKSDTGEMLCLKSHLLELEVDGRIGEADLNESNRTIIQQAEKV